MNAAARLLSHGNLSRSWVVSVILSRAQFSSLVMIIAVLVSALSVVYVTNTARCLNASIQQTLAERNQLHIQWSQLLLEKSTWITPARVQQVAESNLGMVVPDNKSLVIVNE
jgi:cell division protein FtsL